jgi:branched-chain amino acid transport system substrate-binding protein
VHENIDYGTSISGSITDAAKACGEKLAQEISYNANSTDVSAQVLELKNGTPSPAMTA